MLELSGGIENLWLASDYHFWHSKVIHYCKRPWRTVEEMNYCLIDNWNQTVSAQDPVIFFGDFAFCGPGKIRAIVEQLHGRKFLIRGNHDRKFSISKWTRMGFEEVHDQGVLHMPDGSLVDLSHFPYRSPWWKRLFNDDRYPHLRVQDQGRWLIHGHVHNAWKVRGKQINVGCDVWDYRPVHINEIKRIMAS